MSDVQATLTRPDIDILEDIETLIVRYPPSANDRHHLHVDVQNGIARLTGYVKTNITQRYLADQIPLVPGVVGIEFNRLYCDETIRLEVGQVLPVGMFATVEYGSVILSGTLPASTGLHDLVTKVGAVAGVRRVLTTIRP